MAFTILAWQCDVVDVDAVTARLIRRFGPDVVAWCGDVPALASGLAARWGLSLGESFGGGASSVVVRCGWPDGTPAVLKLSPDRALLAEQVEVLEVLAPSGRVPVVLAAAIEAGAVVLEEVLPGTPAEELPAESLPERWADLLSALHGVPAPAGWGRDLRGRCEEFFVRIGRRLSDPAIRARIDRAAWDRAVGRCGILFDTQVERVLLHGDLHLGNALEGGPSRGLTAIDPKACVGDPCFDAVDYVVAGAGEEGIDVRCERVAEACGLDADRLYGWSQVVALLAAIAHLSTGRSSPVLDELLAVSR